MFGEFIINLFISFWGFYLYLPFNKTSLLWFYDFLLLIYYNYLKVYFKSILKFRPKIYWIIKGWDLEFLL